MAQNLFHDTSIIFNKMQSTWMIPFYESYDLPSTEMPTQNNNRRKITFYWKRRKNGSKTGKSKVNSKRIYCFLKDKATHFDSYMGFTVKMMMEGLIKIRCYFLTGCTDPYFSAKNHLSNPQLRQLLFGINLTVCLLLMKCFQRHRNIFLLVVNGKDENKSEWVSVMKIWGFWFFQCLFDVSISMWIICLSGMYCTQVAHIDLIILASIFFFKKYTNKKGDFVNALGTPICIDVVSMKIQSCLEFEKFSN